MGINILHKPSINFKAMSWTDRFIVFCGVGFGSGLLPKAPGTFGSAFALLFIPLWLAIGLSSTILAIILMSLIGIYICGHTAKVMGVHDSVYSMSGSPGRFVSLTVKLTAVSASCWMTLLLACGRPFVFCFIFTSLWHKPYLGLEHVNDCDYSCCR